MGNWKSIRWPLAMMVLLAALGMLGLASYATWQLRAEGKAAKIELTQRQVQTARSIVVYYAQQAESGHMTQDEAKTAARNLLRALRYGDNEYFFVYDSGGTTVVQGSKPEREGKNFLDSKDANGYAYVPDMIKSAQHDGGGQVYYSFPKSGSSDPLPKVSSMLAYSPWDWNIGTGVYMDQIDTLFWKNATTFGVIFAGILAIISFAAISLAGSIIRPIKQLAQTTILLANGQTDIEVENTRRRDELGPLAQALERWRTGLIENDRLRHEQRQLQDEQVRRRHQEMTLMADALEQRIKSSVALINGSVQKLHEASHNLSANAEQTQRQSAEVANSTEQASANVQTVAAASTELTSSIAEISRRVVSAAQIAVEASREAKATTDRIGGLEVAVHKIGEVVSLINDIASQTNLLALNATIESARAGEAGKGFAVVAHEVKNLAGQTGRATEDIAHQIASIQEETRQAVAAVDGIAAIIERINEMSASISSAVEEQGAATSEIARNVEQASDGTRMVSENITGVAKAADNTGHMAQAVFGAAGDLVRDVGTLEKELEEFLREVRAA